MIEHNHKADDWTDEEIRKLIRLWHAINSPMLIGFILGRSTSSIQTRAIKAGLPKRNLPEGIKKKWGSSDRETISSFILNKIKNNEKIDIVSYSRSVLRTPDSILNLMHIEYNCSYEQIKSIITFDNLDNILNTPSPKIKSASERICIKCSRPFWSEWSGNRLCCLCTSTDEWAELS